MVQSSDRIGVVTLGESLLSLYWQRITEVGVASRVVGVEAPEAPAAFEPGAGDVSPAVLACLAEACDRLRCRGAQAIVLAGAVLCGYAQALQARAQGVEGGDVLLETGEIETAGHDAGVLAQHQFRLAAEDFGFVAHLDGFAALVGGERDEDIELGFEHREGAVDGVEVSRGEGDGNEVLGHREGSLALMESQTNDILLRRCHL